jgi:hypothetical protein
VFTESACAHAHVCAGVCVCVCVRACVQADLCFRILGRGRRSRALGAELLPGTGGKGLSWHGAPAAVDCKDLSCAA